MLLNCIRHKVGLSHRRCSSPADILSLPFGDDPCEKCVKMADGKRKEEEEDEKMGMMINKVKWMELLERDRPLVSPPISASAAVPSAVLASPFPAAAAPFVQQHFLPSKHPTNASSANANPCNVNGGEAVHGTATEMGAPINGGTAENVQPPRPARSGTNGTVSGGTQRPATATSHATLLLQQLRGHTDQNGLEETVCVNGSAAGKGNAANYVFLEFQGETKRSALPANVRSVEQLKSLFLRSFPSLSPAQLRSAGVKVYIQNAHSPHRLFYELEDIREVGNHSVLKLFEHSLPSSSSTHFVPNRPPRSVPPEEYFSEPDMAENTVSMRTVEHAPLRPASVQLQFDEEQYHQRTTRPTAIGWREQASDSWQSSSAYSSDSSTSGPYARSGTTTPVHIREDHHTQRKVDSLERQLASLSELVRSALLPPRQLSGAHWRELCQLHTDIVGFSANASASTAAADIGTMSGSVCSTASNATLPLDKCAAAALSSRTVNLRELAAIRADLEALRSETIRNAMRGRVLLEQTLDKIRTARGWPRTEQDELERRKDTCENRLERLQRALREFEQGLENTRCSVLNSTRRLHLNEVDELTSKLGEIGREAVELKMAMPTLHRDIEETMRRLIERVEGEERFLREKVPLVDGCLRRCKTLANVMVTMKKLALVQDERGGVVSGEGRAQRRNIPIRHIAMHKNGSRTATTTPTANGVCPRGTHQQQQHGHPLDAILDELNGNDKGM